MIMEKEIRRSFVAANRYTTATRYDIDDYIKRGITEKRDCETNEYKDTG